jgi:anthranilate phosphoribosyltransferase
MKEVLNRLFEYKSLDRYSAKEILTNLAQGKYNHSEMAAFLTVYLMRSITVEELAGFRDAMLELCVRIDIDDYDAIDLCGTGGDGKDTFNISTLASFVVAGAGQYVAKHGNSSVSSVCGSSNVLEYFGHTFTKDIDNLKRSLDKSGICYLHAPLFHPAMKNVAPVRKQLGVKTFFNMLGPIVNPSFPKKQLTGVFNLELARLYSYLFQQTKTEFMVVHALDGYDEVSLTGKFKILTRNHEQIISPAHLHLQTFERSELSGGNSVEDAAKIFVSVLENRATRAQKEVTIANAAMALFVAKNLTDMEQAVALATESLESGRAFSSFKSFISSR